MEFLYAILLCFSLFHPILLEGGRARGAVRLTKGKKRLPLILASKKKEEKSFATEE